MTHHIEEFLSVHALRRGEEVLIRRRRNGVMSQAEAANTLGVSINTQAKYERGLAKMPDWMLVKAREIWPVDRCEICDNQLFIVIHRNGCVSPKCRCGRQPCPNCRPAKGGEANGRHSGTLTTTA